VDPAILLYQKTGENIRSLLTFFAKTNKKKHCSLRRRKKKGKK